MDNGAFISKEEGKVLIDEYQINYPNSKKAHLYDNNLVQEMLDQVGCVGIRIYHGQKENAGDQCLVIVGVDSLGNDLTDFKILELGAPCPTICPETSYFNS